MFVNGSVAWTSQFIIFICIVLANVEASFIPVQANREARCLLQSGWWSGEHYDNKTHCDWSGVTCNHAGSVANISSPFTYAYISERVLEIWNSSCFPNLVRLDLSRTGIEGTIPPAIGSLSKLTHLDLSGNRLIGQLPLSLANLSQLVVLDLSNNHLSGSIPREIGSLRNLVALDLSSNHFSNRIPWAIGLLTNLTDLILSHNQI